MKKITLLTLMGLLALALPVQAGIELLHKFAGGTADGAKPIDSLLISGTTLYGMTKAGGDSNLGTIFKIQVDGTGFTLLHLFTGGAADGANPNGSLILSGSTLYGMTCNGGDSNLGTIFKIQADGTGFTLLHLFKGGAADGANPYGSLILSGSTLFGMTCNGGDADFGTVFKIKTGGTEFALLHEFVGGAYDGKMPRGSLTLSGSTLYGMTYWGGEGDNGTIFNMQSDGSGFALLHEFADFDGANPYGSLMLSGTTLYGMTLYGGYSSMGTIFKMQIDGSSFGLLHEFTGFTEDGGEPYGCLLLSGSTLCGMILHGGISFRGIIFTLQNDGSGFTAQHEFVGGADDGTWPYGSLILSGSTLYGMTRQGGDSDLGVIFSLTMPIINVTSPNGGENWKVGSSHDITWTADGAIADVNIDYSIDNGSTWTPLAAGTVNDGGFSWTVPDETSAACLVRVSDAVGVSSDSSDVNFIIWNDTYAISGTVTHGGSGLAGVIMNGLSGDPVTDGSGFYSTQVAAGWSGTVIPTSPSFAFSPTSTAYSNVTSNQTTNYEADIIQALVVTSPANAALWEKGKTYPISWLKQGAQNTYVKISLYKGASTLVLALNAKTLNDGSFDWLVPKTSSTGSTYFIRVQTIDNSIKDDSDKFAIIVPAITVTSPTSGMVWVKDTTKTITWNKVGTQNASVRIQLFKDTLKKLDITPGNPNSGSYDWAIPTTLANGTYTIHITTLDGKVKGTSKSFTIARGMIRVTAPIAGVLWQRGVTHTITWSGEGTLNASVKVQLYQGTTLVKAIITTTPNDGSFEWTIPATQALAANYRIRVTTVDDKVMGQSGLFAITSSAGLTLLVANGEESR